METKAKVLTNVTQKCESHCAENTTEGGDSRYYVSDEVELYFNIVLNIMIETLLSLFGVFGNILNMFVFYKLGLKDSMSMGIFALSFNDLLVSSLQLGMSACKSVELLYSDSFLDLSSLGFFVFPWAKNIAYLISCWLTAMISTERCLCVVFPFKIKSMFTKSRSMALILTIYTANIAMHIPIFVPQRMRWETKSDVRVEGNVTVLTTRYVLKAIFTPETSRIEKLVDLVGTFILSSIAQFVILVCAVWMIAGLKASAKIRVSGVKEDTTGHLKKMTTISASSHHLEAAASTTSTQGPTVASKTESTTFTQGPTVAKNKSRLSAKEARLVIVVLFLAILMASCNIPRVTLLTVYHQLGLSQDFHHNITHILLDLSEFFTTICSSTNIVVYIILNSSYRKIVANCCRCQT